MKKVFLGGTCNGSKWRDGFVKELTEIDWYNPVVENWTPYVQEEEIRQRKNCDYVLYVLTPLMTGFYSVAEVVDDSNKRPDKTVLLVLNEDGGQVFTPHQIKSLEAIKNLVKANGANVCDNWSTTVCRFV